MPTPWRAALLLSAPFIAHPAAAEMMADPTIIVNGELPLAAKSEALATAGGIDLVPASAYADRLAVSLRDALDFSPGVYLQPRYGQEVRISVRGSGLSRGFHMRGLTLMQDGVPINFADNNGDFQEFDPQGFELVEVWRGGNALRLGGATLGGVINAHSPTGRSAPGVTVRMDGGSYGTLRGRVAAGHATERGDAHLALSFDRSDGDRDHSERRSLRFNGNAGLVLGDGVETRFHAALNHIRQDMPGTLALEDVLERPRYSREAVRAGDQKRDIESIRLQNRTTIDLDKGSLVFGGFANLKKLWHPIHQVLDQHWTVYGVFARIGLEGTVGAVPVELNAGSSARFGRIDARQYVNNGGRRGALTADTRQLAQGIESFAELRVQPVDQLWLTAGGLHSHGRRRIRNVLDADRSGRASFDAFSPKIGMLYEAGPVQVYANYSRSVELPGLSELSATPFGGLPGFVDLRPQRAWTAEIGSRGSIGAASWNVSLYRSTLTGEMLQFTPGPDIPAATFNAGRTLHQGVEAALDLRIAPWLLVRQNYMYSDFRFRNDQHYGNNRLPVVPPHLYRAELRIGDDSTSVSPRLEWAPRGAFADYENRLRVPGYALLGLSASHRLSDRATIFLDARNLADKRAVGDITAAVTATPLSEIFYPVERRSIYGGFRLTL